MLSDDFLQQRLQIAGLGFRYDLALVRAIDHYCWPPVANGSIGELNPVLSDLVARIFPIRLGDLPINDRWQMDRVTASWRGRQDSLHPHRISRRGECVALIQPIGRIYWQQSIGIRPEFMHLPHEGEIRVEAMRTHQPPFRVLRFIDPSDASLVAVYRGVAKLTIRRHQLSSTIVIHFSEDGRYGRKSLAGGHPRLDDPGHGPSATVEHQE